MKTNKKNTRIYWTMQTCWHAYSYTIITIPGHLDFLMYSAFNLWNNFYYDNREDYIAALFVKRLLFHNLYNSCV